MKKYEYNTYRKSTDSRYGFERGSQKEQDFLNIEGRVGWQLVSVVNEAMGNASMYYFKREIPN